MLRLPWRKVRDQNRLQFRVGGWLGCVEWWEGGQDGNWALYRDGELMANDIAATVALGQIAVEDVYMGWFSRILE